MSRRGVGRRVGAQAAFALLQALPPTAKSVVYAFAGLAAGWSLHEAVDRQGAGRPQPRWEGRTQSPAGAGVDAATSRILGQGSSPTVSFRRLGENFVAEVDAATRTPRWVGELLTPASLALTAAGAGAGAGAGASSSSLPSSSSPLAALLSSSSSSSGGGSGSRREGISFREETGLPTHLRARLSDYAGSGYDRGHMAAAANHRGGGGGGGGRGGGGDGDGDGDGDDGDGGNGQGDLADTFYLSNVAPQVGAGFNRAYYARLEAWVRSLLSTTKSGGSNRGEEGGQAAPWDEVRVLTGPLYLPAPTQTSSSSSSSSSAGSGWHYSHPALGQPGAWLPVPTHFFKVVLATRKRTPSGAPVVDRGVGGDMEVEDAGSAVEAVAAFVLPNAPTHPARPLTDFLVPLATLESLSGLQLFRERLGPAGIAEADEGLKVVLRLPSSSPSGDDDARKKKKMKAKGGGKGAGGSGGSDHQRDDDDVDGFGDATAAPNGPTTNPAQAALALHIARGLTPPTAAAAAAMSLPSSSSSSSSSMPGGTGEKQKGGKAGAAPWKEPRHSWPPLSTSIVPSLRSHTAADPGANPKMRRRAWHLCAVTTCSLPAEGWYASHHHHNNGSRRD